MIISKYDCQYQFITEEHWTYSKLQGMNKVSFSSKLYADAHFLTPSNPLQIS